MGGMASTAPGPSAVRRPHRRPPRRVRWPRRVAGVLATLGLFGVAAVMTAMFLPSPADTASVTVPEAPAVAAKHKPAAKAKQQQAGKAAKPLTAKQLAARAAAVMVLRDQGYLPTREKDYNPRKALRVLVGYRNGDPLGPRRAFFFVGERFIGHDSTASSSSVKVVRSGKRSVTLAYGVYAPGAEACCPASTSKVTFKWSGTALAPQGLIPAGRLATG
jgi:hypothetical protein